MLSESRGSYSDLDWRGVAKEVGLAGLVAFGLSIALVGLRTVDAETGSGASLALVTRFADVAWVIVLVMLGRLGLILDREGLPLPALVGAVAVAAVTQIVPMPGEALPVLGLVGGGVVALKAGLT
ncbi:MAG: branched-chain amino acid ABC transporter permease, partial [Tistlia sp.]